MSAISKMKAELTRLGVEYDFTDRLYEVPSYQSVTWRYNTADWATFREYHDGSTQLIVHSSKCGITPEEAIAATLGPKVCHMSYNELSNTSICLACGWRMDGKPNYCPNCGRKAVYE